MWINPNQTPVSFLTLYTSKYSWYFCIFCKHIIHTLMFMWWSVLPLGRNDEGGMQSTIRQMEENNATVDQGEHRSLLLSGDLETAFHSDRLCPCVKPHPPPAPHSRAVQQWLPGRTRQSLLQSNKDDKNNNNTVNEIISAMNRKFRCTLLLKV